MNGNDFDRFVSENADGLLRTAYLIVWDLPEAEDLLQETLLKVAKRWPKVSRMDHPIAYARRILVNLALAAGPKRSRRRAELREAQRASPRRAAPLTLTTTLCGARGASAAPARGDRAALLPRPSRSRGRGRTSVLPRHCQEHGFSWTRATRADAAPDQRPKEHRLMTQLETDLRAALHERAARVQAPPGVLVTDYHPRTRRLRPPVAIGGGLATAVCAHHSPCCPSPVVPAAHSPAGHPSRPAPTARQLAAAQAYCAQNEPTPGLPLKLTDTRGPFTFEVYADDSANDFCITGPSFTNASGFSTSAAEDRSRRAAVSLGRAHHDPRRAVLRVCDRPRRRWCERGNADPRGRHRGDRDGPERLGGRVVAGLAPGHRRAANHPHGYARPRRSR